MSFWSKVGDLAKAGLEKSKEVIAEELRLLKDEYENYDDGLVSFFLSFVS